MSQSEVGRQCTAFLHSIFPEIPDTTSLHEIIKDGVILCRIVHILSPEFPLKVDKRQIAFVFGANIQNFINYCREIHIPDVFLPAPLSVVNNEPQAMKNIVACLLLIHNFSGIGIWEVAGGTENLINMDQFQDIKLDKIDFGPIAAETTELRQECGGDRSSVMVGIDCVPHNDILDNGT